SARSAKLQGSDAKAAELRTTRACALGTGDSGHTVTFPQRQSLHPFGIAEGRPERWAEARYGSTLWPSYSDFLSNLHASRLCSNGVRTRAARAMGPISLGLAVTS